MSEQHNPFPEPEDIDAAAARSLQQLALQADLEKLQQERAGRSRKDNAAAFVAAYTRPGNIMADIIKEARARALEEAAQELAQLQYVRPGAPGREEYEAALAIRRGGTDHWLKARAAAERAQAHPET